MNAMPPIENIEDGRPNFFLYGDDPLAPPLLRILAAAHIGSFSVALRALDDLMLTAHRAGVFSVNIEIPHVETARSLEDLAYVFDIWRADHPDRGPVDG